MRCVGLLDMKRRTSNAMILGTCYLASRVLLESIEKRSPGKSIKM